MKIFRNVLTTAIALLLFSTQSFAQNMQFRALLFTKTAGFHHESILAGVTAIKELSARHLFAVDWQENASVFNDQNLEKYQVVIFLNTTGDVFNESQQQAMEKFIRSGKGFVGIHSASDTEYEWEWYTKMVGRMFHIHPQIQTAMIDVVDANFPGLERMPKRLLWTDEWYEFTPPKTDDLHSLITLDETTYDPNVKWGEKVGKPMGVHPVSWYHLYDGGRAFYTALGHVPTTFSDDVFLDHLYGAIYWAATGKGIKK
ncbi:MAG: ThuA domain-containing protein [Bacteroidia bacterium]|nr:ThuA domain-containing protein [Bacteroidia bacterium]